MTEKCTLKSATDRVTGTPEILQILENAQKQGL
jgi:hypothetical protein